MPLRFTHVLISRPEAESVDLARRLEAAGLTPIVMPAFRFSSTGVRVESTASWREAPCRLAVFTSPRAVEFGLNSLSPDFLANTVVAAVGPATARALEKSGVRVDAVPGGEYTSESLLALPQLGKGPGEAVIFAAPGGRRALSQGLGSRGWTVRVAAVYRRELTGLQDDAVASLRSAQRPASVWTSATAMDSTIGKLPPEIRRSVLEGPWVVVSDRLATHARSLDAREVHVASGPDNRSLARSVLALLE